MAILLAIVLTFFGAACYRVGVHMQVAALRNALPQRALDLLGELLALCAGPLPLP